MPNIASILKSEISRVSRKEIRVHNEALAKATRHHRSEIGALKARLLELEKLVKRMGRSSPQRAPAAAAAGDGEGPSARFSAKGLVSHRKRLGLSAAELGQLVGASAQTIYNWESGASRPRASFLPAIAGMRSLGKREVRARLEQKPG